MASSKLSMYISKKPSSLQFCTLSKEEILKQSVAEVTNEKFYDDLTRMPAFGGVNDPRMGTVHKDRICYTCKAGPQDCSGHFGHMVLAKPVYHGGFLEHVRKILKCICINCSKLLIRDTRMIEMI